MTDILAPKKHGLKNRIHMVGIELEGGWTTLPSGYVWDSGGRNHDGSVVFDNPQPPPGLNDLVMQGQQPARKRPALPKYVGEIPSEAMPYSAAPESEWEAWMRLYYPQFVNETCGLHTHTSFRFKLNYMRLMTPEFTKYIVKGLSEWAEGEKLSKSHPIWPRLTKGDHNHCAHLYLGDNQVKVARKDYRSRGTPHSRYTAVNYCWEQHKTVECRLLPMMETADQGVRAVKEVFTLTNRFLSKVRQKEIRAEARVALSPEVNNHYRIRV